MNCCGRSAPPARIALWITLLVLLSAALLPGCSRLPASGPIGGALVISEVVTSNSHSLKNDILGTPDWIELYNGTNAPISLKGCGLSDNIREPHKWTFPDVTIGPGEYLIVYATSLPNAWEQGLLCTGYKLSKNGETLLLTDRYYNMLAELTVPPLRQDVSYALDPATGRYGYCAAPTPGEANAGVVESLEDISYVSGSGALVLSEAVPRNGSVLRAADGRYYPFAELYNASNAALDLSQFFLSDDPGDFFKWSLPEQALPPGEYALVFFSGEDGVKGGELHAAFRLGSEDDSLLLSDATGQVIGQLNWDLALCADLGVVTVDGRSAYTAFPTPGAPNSAAVFQGYAPAPMDGSDPVRLSEILPRNRYSLVDQDGDRSSWAELYNTSQAPVSLLGYYLSDDPGDPAKWALPDVTLEPGEYQIVFLSGKDRTEGELHAGFRLSRNDRALQLTNLNGMRCDCVPLDPDMGENVSYGLGADGGWYYFAQPTPGAQNNTAGQAMLSELSRMDLSGVFISEVCAVNPAKSGKRDWVELYNGGDAAVNLSGWYLSDNPSLPQKYQIKSLSIPAKGYGLLYASSSTAKQQREGETAPFGISEGGETLMLSNAQGQIVDWFETGALRAGTTSGRDVTDASGKRFFYTSATPGARNGESRAQGYAAAPVFSETGLYQKAAFSLSLTSATPGASIYYTLDGSKPDADATLYTGPIQVSGNRPVRAVSMAEGLLPSDIVSYTYLFESAHTLPVVCLSGDPGAISQVYSVTDRWNKIEREGYCAYYEADGSLGVKFPCGLRVNGAGTLTMRQKSLSIFLRTGYGRGSVTYPFFPGYDIRIFESLCIRNSGQDASRARLRDSFFSLAVEGLNIDNVATRPVVVYINGEYWGLYDLNENQNEGYLEAHYGVDPDTVEIIRRNTTALAGSKEEFKRVRAFGLNRDLSDEDLYQKFIQWVDEDYFIDYIIAQTYFSNSDMFNQKYWHTSDNKVRWRPVFYDLDLAMGGTNPSRNILSSYFRAEGVPSRDGSLTNMDIYVGLKKNAGWREKFCARYVYVALNYFNADRLIKILDDHAAAMEPEMPRHIQRWRYPSSMSAWRSSVAALRDCLAKRGGYALRQLQSYFGLTDAQMQAYRDAAGA